MKPVMQTKFGEEGNCWTACLASILELDIAYVPDFVNIYQDSEMRWFYEAQKWLRKMDLMILRAGYKYYHKGVWNINLIGVPLSVLFIASGKCGHYNDARHAVVGRIVGDSLVDRFQLVHDPSPVKQKETWMPDVIDFIVPVPSQIDLNAVKMVAKNEKKNMP